MRQFYLIFPNGYALRSELSWTHYRLLMRVENDNARQFYTDEAVKSQWSTRQLERQINTFFYERLLSSKLQIQVNKSSVEAVDEAQKKQKEAEKKMEQAESKARNEKKRAELEIRKAKKEVRDRTKNMKAMEYFWEMGYITVVLFAILQNGAFHSGNLNGDNYGNNKTIQKKVERNFTNVFDWKPFRDSSAWRCNQRVSTCEFDPVICVCQYGNRVAQSVPGVPDMQLNPCY